MERGNLTEEEALRFYKEAYQREKRRGRALRHKLAEAEKTREATQRKLDKIRKSLPWRASKPLRTLYHKLTRMKERLGCYGSLKGIARKVGAKMIERRRSRRQPDSGFTNLTGK